MLDKYLTVSVNARTVFQIFRGARDGWIREFRILLEYLYVLHDRCIFNLAISRKTRPRDETNISKKIISIKLKKKIFRIFQYFENIYNFLKQCRIFLYEWYCNWIKIYIYILSNRKFEICRNLGKELGKEKSVDAIKLSISPKGFEVRVTFRRPSCAHRLMNI